MRVFTVLVVVLAQVLAETTTLAAAQSAAQAPARTTYLITNTSQVTLYACYPLQAEHACMLR